MKKKEEELMKKKKINVIGLGYIGLPTASMFADNGMDVIGVDVSESIVNRINQGLIHIEEPGLADLVKKVVKNGNLAASLKPTEADIYVIAVPTPSFDDEFKGCNLKYVKDAVLSIIPYIKKGNIVIIESTISPRTTEDEIKPIFESYGFNIGKDIYLSHCPERVLPGQILEELVNNNRIVGGVTPKCADKAAEVYELFVNGEIVKTEAKTAEMSKLMENTYRDINIAIANELSKICNELSINVLEVIEMANKHPRVNILNPGPGVGGHCLAVDPYFIYAETPETAKLIKTARDINNSMPEYVVETAVKLTNNDTSKIITIFGVTYKPDVDDLRESPALKIAEKIINKGYSVKIHDPFINNENYLNVEESLRNSDLLLCLVGHRQFKNLDMNVLDDLMHDKKIFDVANIFSDFNEDFIINFGNLYKHLN